MEKRILHRSEKEIIRVIFKESRPVSIHEIAELSGMSWITAKKYLNSLNKKNIISFNHNLYEIDKELIKILLKRRRNENN